MRNNLRRKKFVTTGMEAHVDEIIGRLALNPAAEKFASLPFNVASLQKDFNAQLELLLEENFADEDIPPLKELLSLDESKIFSDAETLMLAKIFGECAGLFGFGEAGGNFKILSLCFINPRRRFDKQISDLLFKTFTKTFLPKVDTAEIVAVLNENNFFTVAGVVFESVQTGTLNMLNVFAE